MNSVLRFPSRRSWMGTPPPWRKNCFFPRAAIFIQVAHRSRRRAPVHNHKYVCCLPEARRFPVRSLFPPFVGSNVLHPPLPLSACREIVPSLSGSPWSGYYFFCLGLRREQGLFFLFYGSVDQFSSGLSPPVRYPCDQLPLLNRGTCCPQARLLLRSMMDRSPASG